MARILVVDDESNIRMMICLALQHVGHIVDVAADGYEGLQRFNDGTEWDLILLDHRMPDLEGIEVLKQIRYHDRTVKVIMITAFGTIDLAVEAMKAGATDFLRKPFTADILRGAVAAALKSTEPSQSTEKIVPAATSGGPTFGMTTINGFRIEFRANPGLKMEGGLGFDFQIRNPEDQTQRCTVVLSTLTQELVRAHADREEMPGGARFWQALCEEAIANYLWQNADFPPDNLLLVDDLNTGLKRFINSVLTV